MATQDQERKEFIMPTAINMLNVVNENIVANLRRRKDAAIELPSLYQLAFMVHHNTGELLITRTPAEED